MDKEQKKAARQLMKDIGWDHLPVLTKPESLLYDDTPVAVQINMVADDNSGAYAFSLEIPHGDMHDYTASYLKKMDWQKRVIFLHKDLPNPNAFGMNYFDNFTDTKDSMVVETSYNDDETRLAAYHIIQFLFHGIEPSPENVPPAV